MEFGNPSSGGPTSTTTTNSRPIRSSSRYFSGGPSSGNFIGPVRRWQKKWVHVSPSQPSIKPTRSQPQSNAHKLPTSSPILLCKWTPLPTPAVDGGDAVVSGEFPRRKVRYTPIAVIEEQKKVTADRVSDQAEEMPETDSDDSYGMLDINADLTESHQGTSKSRPVSHYSRRS